MNNVIRQSLIGGLMALSLGGISLPAIAGGGSDISEAPYNEIQLNPISMREAETLVGKQEVYFLYR